MALLSYPRHSIFHAWFMISVWSSFLRRPSSNIKLLHSHSRPPVAVTVEVDWTTGRNGTGGERAAADLNRRALERFIWTPLLTCAHIHSWGGIFRASLLQVKESCPLEDKRVFFRLCEGLGRRKLLHQPILALTTFVYLWSCLLQ